MITEEKLPDERSPTG